MAVLVARDIAFGRVSDVAGLAAHPHLREVSVSTPGGPVALPAPPARRIGEVATFGPVPAAGAHGAAIRAEFLAKSGR